MLVKLMIGLASFLIVAGTVSGMELQPSWAPVPTPIIQGQAYRTGSPLSRPGGLGLLGGLANAVTNGQLPEFTGGGSIVWEGETPTCAGIEVNSICLPTMTPAEARAAKAAAPATTENAPRMGNGERADCGYSFAKAVEMDSAFDWCAGEKIEYAHLPECPIGQRLFATMIKDDELGARTFYTCQEVAQ